MSSVLLPWQHTTFISVHCLFKSGINHLRIDVQGLGNAEVQSPAAETQTVINNWAELWGQTSEDKVKVP